MEQINNLYQQYVSCGGDLSLEEIYNSCIDSIENDPDRWQSKDLEEAVKNLLVALVYIRCTPYSKIMELAEESLDKRSEKYLSLSQEVKNTIKSLNFRAGGPHHSRRLGAGRKARLHISVLGQNLDELQ